MANLAIFASGKGTNFDSIARAAMKSEHHSLRCLVCNRTKAYVVERAKALSVPIISVSYGERERNEVEEEILTELSELNIDIIALAGYMKLLTPRFVDAYSGRILNIHPALLPKYPGTHGIEESYESDDEELGITIHLVDYGTDTGPILLQKSFKRTKEETLDEIAERIHKMEHLYYPEVIIGLLDSCGENSN